jgi:hypothetical protein
MLLRQITGNNIPKLPRRVTGVLTRLVQREDVDRAGIQMRQYGRHLSVTGGRLLVEPLSTLTVPAGHFYHSELKILVGGVLYFGQ